MRILRTIDVVQLYDALCLERIRVVNGRASISQRARTSRDFLIVMYDSPVRAIHAVPLVAAVVPRRPDPRPDPAPTAGSDRLPERVPTPREPPSATALPLGLQRGAELGTRATARGRGASCDLSDARDAPPTARIVATLQHTITDILE